VPASGWDGLRRPPNAPPGQAVGIGVQPGVQNPFILAQYVIVYGPTGALTGVFLYQTGTSPGPGNPPIAAMTNSSTDPFGNSVRPGDSAAAGSLILLGPVPSGGSNSFVQLVAGTDLNVLLGTGDPNESSPGSLIGEISGSGPGRTLDTAITSPDFASGVGTAVTLGSRSADNSTQGAFFAAQAGIYSLLVGERGSVGNGGMLYYNDSAGTWSVVRSMTDTTPHTINSASAQQFTNNWTVPANDAVIDTQYRIKAHARGTAATTTAEGLTITVFGESSTIPAADQSPGNALSVDVEVCVTITAAGSGGKCTVATRFDASNPSGSNNGVVVNLNEDVAFNTTVAQSLELTASWASVTGAPTITCYDSSFERLGS